jgi:molecular chaperone GrpE (heat shock protein)
MPPFYALITALATIVTAIGGAFLTIRKITTGFEQTRKLAAAAVLQAAKEADAVIYADLNAKLDTLQAEFENFKKDTNKDLKHQKENYTNEIAYLGQKIEVLRDEIKVQHVNILNLLNKMIDKK